MRTFVTGIALVGCFAAGESRSLGQPAAPAFEVVSVKPSQSGSTRFSYRWSPGGAFSAHLPLVWMIGISHDIRPLERITGGPDWVRNQHFEIEARAGREVPRQESMAMLRTLLATRFGLVLRARPGELTGYTLRLARADGRLGPGLRRSERPCLDVGRAPVEQRQLREGQPVPCGLSAASGVYGGASQPIGMLVATLRPIVGTEIEDRSGLTGQYDYYFTTSGVSAQLVAAPGSDVSIFTAVEEQLGLKLEPARIGVDEYVIERVEQPEPN